MNYYLYKYNYKDKILLISILYGSTYFVYLASEERGPASYINNTDIYNYVYFICIAEANYYQILLTFIFSNMGKQSCKFLYLSGRAHF